MTWNIRPARAADLPAIVAIYNSTIESRASTADLAPVSVASRQAWFAAHHGNRPLYVVEDTDGTIAAWGSFSDYYPRQRPRQVAAAGNAATRARARHQKRPCRHLRA